MKYHFLRFSAQSGLFDLLFCFFGFVTIPFRSNTRQVNLGIEFEFGLGCYRWKHEQALLKIDCLRLYLWTLYRSCKFFALSNHINSCGTNKQQIAWNSISNVWSKLTRPTCKFWSLFNIISTKWLIFAMPALTSPTSRSSQPLCRSASSSTMTKKSLIIIYYHRTLI